MGLKWFASVKSLCFSFGVLSLSACSTYPAWFPAAGASREQIKEAPAASNDLIHVLDVNDALARRLLAGQQRVLFSEVLGRQELPQAVLGAGDVVEVTIWEAPPATLFGVAGGELGRGVATSRPNALPEQVIAVDGKISVPFVGGVQAAGKSVSELEVEIARRLKDKANQPQVLVRVLRNATANVTVVGEVATSLRMPLSPKGERLLDALAAAGGTRQPVNKLSVQLTRGERVVSLPLETIIRDPKQNVPLLPGDVLTFLSQPLSLSVLGATGKNEELNFEAQGISLSQALARAGGLQDARADAAGVFVFRFEAKDALTWEKEPKLTPDNKVPVVYRFDLKDPATFFVAQNFPMQSRDVMYVANAPGAEFQKFLNIVLGATIPLFNVVNLTR